MSAIFESVIAVESFHKEDARQKAISEVFLQSVWKEDEFQEKPVNLARFEEIVEN